MKNKAFTLVELLAVIIIISVLSLIIVSAISTYIKNGKDSYNENLKEELLIIAKNYLSENPNLLPKKTYLETKLIKQEVITLQEMQSENFTTNEFYDADNRPCQNSYVVVAIPANETEEEYHACLICGNEGEESINYSENDRSCSVTNFSEGENPTCKSTIMGGTVSNSIRYNPLSITISEIAGDIDEANISQVWIENLTTNDSKVIDVEDKTIEEIKNLNLVEYLTTDGEYEILIRDTRGNYSSPCNSERIIIDKTKPTCNLVYNEDTQTFEVETQDNISSKNDTIVLDEKQNINDAFNETGISKPLKDGTYYGYVKDEAGNINECENSLDTNITVKPTEKPRCYVLSGNYTILNNSSKKATYKLECYLYQGENGTIDNSKIVSKNDLGKITITKDNNNDNKENKVIVNINYTANNNTTGNDNIVINPGFVKSGSESNSSLTIQESDFKVDTENPIVSITSTNNVAASQTVTLSCSDDSKIASYYWGTTAPTSSTKFTSISNVTTYRTTKTVNAAGTYYFACKDASGNTSSTTSRTFYKTTLNMRNGTVSPTSVITMRGNSFTLPTPKANTNYIIKGAWYSNSALTSIVSSPYTPTSSRTLYSGATLNTRDINYYCPSGSTNCPSDATVIYGNSYTISSTRPSKTGYQFYRWNTSSSGTGTKYTPGTRLSSVTSNINLYATMFMPIVESFTCPSSIKFATASDFNWSYDTNAYAYYYTWGSGTYTRTTEFMSPNCAFKNSYDKGLNCVNNTWFPSSSLSNYYINSYDYTNNTNSSNRYSNTSATHTIYIRVKLVVDNSVTFYSDTKSCTYSTY